MKYARVKLNQTNYVTMDNWNYITDINIQQLNEIYKKYCDYKNFDSVMPIFDSQYLDKSIDIIGYYDSDILIAFSMVRRYNEKNAELLQFYFGGIFDPFDKICNRDNLNHAVLVVGWGVQKSLIFGTRPYWIVKNSWGTGWGEKGYFRIIKGKDKCGI
jgi:hypothetical protein